MINGLEAITTSLLGYALDAASLRHQTIAANIANANTIGYVPHRLKFNEQLTEVQKTVRERGTADPFALTSLRLQLEPLLGANGLPAKVQLDAEMVDLAQNSVQFQALLKGLQRHLSILAMAASDGRK